LKYHVRALGKITSLTLALSIPNSKYSPQDLIRCGFCEGKYSDTCSYVSSIIQDSIIQD